VWEALERNGRLQDGWAQDADLFAATWSQRYPDALARVCLALGDLDLYPASVLFSMQDTYTYGPALTHAGGRLLGGVTGNHGGLSSTQSLGFAAVTEDGDDPWGGEPARNDHEDERPGRGQAAGCAPGQSREQRG
jgi:hypothetical protein